VIGQIPINQGLLQSFYFFFIHVRMVCFECGNYLATN
jgi:hypothetical protein